jgi:hypothetical protein
LREKENENREYKQKIEAQKKEIDQLIDTLNLVSARQMQTQNIKDQLFIESKRNEFEETERLRYSIRSQRDTEQMLQVILLTT